MNTDTQLTDLVNFSVTAVEEVEQDYITISFTATETSTNPNKVQTKLAERMKAALDIAREKKKDGAVEIKSGNFHIGPAYNSKGEVNGYSGSVQLTVYGTDMQTISGLTGEISTMNVSGVELSVSPSLRKSVEDKLAIRAIEMYKEKAKAYSEAFGFGEYKLVATNVQVSSGHGYGRRGGARLMASSISMESAVGAYSEEAGKEEVTATVSGSVQLAN